MMKTRIKCELFYRRSLHLKQLYTGFLELKKYGVVDIVVREQPAGDQDCALLHALINDRHKVVYDVLDGLNWIIGSVEENLDYFAANSDCEYYFKGSFDPRLLQMTVTKGSEILELLSWSDQRKRA